MPPSGLVINTMHGVTIVNFHNASILDGSAVEAIGRELYALVDEQAHRKLILDFSSVKFLSSSMIGVLIALHRKSKGIKGRMFLVGLHPELHRVFAIMNLEKTLEFAKNESEAFEALKGFGEA